MRIALTFSLTGLLATPALAGSVQVFRDEGAFVDMIRLIPFSHETFDALPPGAAGPILSFADDQYSFDVTAPGPGSNMLFNDTGLVSTLSENDALNVRVTSNNGMAIGAVVFAGDIDFQPDLALISVTLGQGQTETFEAFAGEFIGFYSSSPIHEISISDDAGNLWPVLDSVYLAGIPAPGSVLPLACAGALASRPRR
ncbi:MAG: hypothetical protein ACIARR_05615 [Phycisphaerales bacterium JB059]